MTHRDPIIVSVTEVDTHFAKLIKKAERGQTLLVTRRGVPAVVMISLQKYEKLSSVRVSSKGQDALDESAEQIGRGQVSSIRKLRALHRQRRK